MAQSTTAETTKPPQEIQNIIAAEETDAFLGDENYNAEVSYLLKTQILDELRTNSEQRIRYARRTFWITCGWIFIVLLIVTCTGINYNGRRLLALSDSVVITLITTTTLNVFGFFLLVMKYLFNREELKELVGFFTK